MDEILAMIVAAETQLSWHLDATGLPTEALDAPELTRLLWLLGRTEIGGLVPARLLG